MNIFLWISSVGSVILAFATSLAFLLILDPNKNSCSIGFLEIFSVFAAFVLLPFVVWSLTLYGSAARYAEYFRALLVGESSQSTSGLGSGLLSRSSGDTLVGRLFINFFDRWLLDALTNLIFLPFVYYYSHRNFLEGASSAIGATFQIRATSILINETVALFDKRHPAMSNKLELSRAPQLVMIYFALLTSAGLLGVIIAGVESASPAGLFLLGTAGLRFIIHLYQVISISSLIKILDSFSDDLLGAVVKSCQLNNVSEDRLDFPFRPPDQIAPAVPESNSLFVSMPQPRPSNPSSEVNSEMCARSDYSQIYLESQKIVDLLKMVSTLLFISICYDVVASVDVVASNYIHGGILEVTLKIMQFLLPWVYLVSCYYSKPATAIANARRLCVAILLALMWGCMCVIGGSLGCDLLADTSSYELKHVKGNNFLIYLAKVSALPTTVALGLVVLTSPGIRSWFSLPALLKYLVVPLLWLPPYVVQELHESAGANFVCLGAVHTIAWVSMVCLRLFSLADVGVLVATVTGVLMLVFSAKLLWPPGMPIPFVKHNSNWLHKKLDVFLRDSKYGSYHVYLASTVLALYIVHGLIIMHFSYSWYFIFACACMGILIFIHPAKRYSLASHLAGVPSEKVRYNIVSKSLRPIRGKGLVAVTLVLDPPTTAAPALFQGVGDIIIVRNRTVRVSSLALSSFKRHCETVHYFSVVGIRETLPAATESGPSRIEVDLLIQKTARPEGASSALVAADESSGDLKHEIEVVGFMKSNSLEAMHSPCLIAFGFESGSAAFCSMLKRRTQMREEIEKVAKIVNVSELTDICVVWTQFMRASKHGVKASEIANAVRELSALQQYIYENSGGRGVKILFVTTGVPLEWTPNPECVVHCTNNLDDAVAAELGYPRINSQERPSWHAPEVGSIPSGDYRPSLTARLRSSLSSWIPDSKGRLSSVNEDDRAKGSVSFVEPDRSRSKIKSSNSALMVGLDRISEGSKNPITSIDEESGQFSHEDRDYNIRLSSLMSVKHQFAKKSNVSAIEMLLQVHNKEESWVPLRHALGSNWSTFKKNLDYRVGSAINWLYQPDGPDYTAIFITEHQSDIPLLRDFKYSEIYDEVNHSIIEHQLQYCKNPREFLTGSMCKDDSDPLNPSPIACAVLYSGDYATTKKDHLNATVNRVRMEQDSKRQPASLLFVPDA